MMIRFASLLLLLISGSMLFAQSNYLKNTHVNYDIQETAEVYRIDYNFKDQWLNQHQLVFEYPRDYTDQRIEQFGMPHWIFKPFRSSPEELKRREKIINEGMFRKSGQSLKIDWSAVVREYAEDYCKPIAEALVQILHNLDKDSRENRISMAMKFVQDIPYGIPRQRSQNRFVGGAAVPPQVIVNGYGDCDSKSMLFAGILAYMVEPEDIAFIELTDHLVTAVRVDDPKGKTFYEYDGKFYALTETVGPGRLELGEQTNRRSYSGKLEFLDFDGKGKVPEPSYQKVQRTGSPQVFHLVFENECNQSIDLLLKYQDLDGNWQIKNWEKLPGTTERLLADTGHKEFYFYARFDGGEWTGAYKNAYEEQDYYMTRGRVACDGDCNYSIKLNCSK